MQLFEAYRPAVRKMKAWQKRQRAYAVLRHGIGLALDAGIEQGGIRMFGEEYGHRVARSLLREAATWHDFQLSEGGALVTDNPNP